MIGKVISQLGKAAAKTAGKGVKSGKPNLPRYLYHITSTKNYESMLKSGEIRTSADTCPISNLEGVFMFDLKNFAKRWTSTFCNLNDKVKVNLGGSLICKNLDSIVVLKIPTKNMDIDKLKVRVQEAKNTLEDHYLNGASARFQTLYTRRKKPIEYIYGDKINISDAKKIGELELHFNLAEKEEILDFVNKRPFDSLLKLFKGTPEEKCVQAMQKANIAEQCLEIP